MPNTSLNYIVIYIFIFSKYQFFIYSQYYFFILYKGSYILHTDASKQDIGAVLETEEATQYDRNLICEEIQQYQETTSG